MMKNLLFKEPRAEIESILKSGQKILQKNGLGQVVVGISGGVDSALVLALLKRIVGKEKILALLMPSDKTSDLSRQVAREVVAWANLPKRNVWEIDISDEYKLIKAKLPKETQPTADKELALRADGNILARLRMIHLFDLAHRNGALVAGTTNRTELELGYYTLYGDQAASFELIDHLYKTQVWQLARELGLPQSVIEKPPSADLWEGQTDEGELGFSYEEADRVLQYMRTEDEDWIKGISPEVEFQVMRKVGDNEYKFQLPYRVKKFQLW